MNIHEMHVKVDLLMQKINSNARRNILPEEKDLVLNQEIQSFVSSKIRRATPYGEFGMSNDEIDSEAISSLVRLYVPLEVQPSSGRSDLSEVLLPGDFRNFISLSALTVPEHCKTVSEQEKSDLIDSTTHLYIFKVPSASSSSALYKNIQLTWGGKTEVIESEGVNDPNYQRFVFNAIRNTGIVAAKDMYWERYPNRFPQKSHIIFRSSVELASNPSLTIDGVLIPVSKVKLDNKVYDKNRTYSNKFNAASRRMKPQFLDTVQQSPFERSNFQSLTIGVEDDKVLIPNGGKFIVTVASLNYVAKPAEVNLSLGIDCDLPDRGFVHDYICQKAAEELLLSIDSPSWQARHETNKIEK